MATRWLALSLAAGAVAAVATLQAQQEAAPAVDQNGVVRFTSGVELVNVTATVSDASGRFVSGLRKEDFVVYEDDQLQTVTHFSAERVPVSLGIVLDTSGSMVGEKIRAARGALDRFLYDLLDPQDEIFLYRFNTNPVLLQGWTSDRRLLSRALDRITPSGETAMYDAVAEAIPLATTGAHRKKALLIISDGNDTSSHVSTSELRRLIRETEVMVYAIGIDGEESEAVRPPISRPRMPVPFPLPPIRRPGRPRLLPQLGGPIWPRGAPNTERVNVGALRELTDSSGGRTEVVRDPRDLKPATAGIADELSQQYYLGYPASGVKDGRWRSIRVEVRRGTYRVRARRGYVAS